MYRPELLHNSKFISIGKMVTISKHSRLEVVAIPNDDKPAISIGNNTSIQHYFHCGAATSVSIGADVLIASRVFITDHDHRYDHPFLSARVSKELRAKPVIINDGAWLGEGVVVLKGVTIGSRSVIGANSVVSKDIPPFCVAAGNPATIIKQFSSTRSLS